MALGFLSKKKTNSQRKPVEAQPRDRLDVLFSVTRRLESRIMELETKVSTLRRDLNAALRKVYREGETQEPLAIKQKPDEFKGMFGIE